MTSLVVHFRSTLDFFENRDRAMMTFHPEKFPHWMRGDRHFNLIDTDNRKVIRFESNRLIIRSEGHDSLEPFIESLNISLEMLNNFFHIKDIFFIQMEIFQVKNEKSLHFSRTNFAKKCLSDDYKAILPIDGDTDYSITFERNNDVDDSLTNDRKRYKNTMNLNIFIFMGPVTGNELKQKFLEFKEDSNLVLYKTPSIVPDYGLMCGTKLSIKPIKNGKFLSNENINYIVQQFIDKADNIWEITFGG